MIVLDTHVWIWWLSNADLLSDRAAEAIEKARIESRIYISSMSVWEIAMLFRLGRLELTTSPEEWVAKSESLKFIRFVPVDNRIAFRSVFLGPKPADPADRIIAATALSLGAPLITKDRKLRRIPDLKTIW